MASDALYQALAEALSQPSRAYRTAQAALDIPNQALQGYVAGGDIADKIGQRKMNKQTLEEALQGNVPERISGYGSLPVTTLKNLGGLDAVAKLTEAPKSKEPYTPRSLDAFLTQQVQEGKMTPEAAFDVKNSGALLRAGYAQGPGRTLNPVPGGKPAREIAEAEAAKANARQNALESSRNALVALNEAIPRVNNFSAGIGGLTAGIPLAPATNLEKTLDPVRAIIGFGELQKLRDASPTGGALGQVSERENLYLQSLKGSLSQIQDPKLLRSTLERIKESYEKQQLSIEGYTKDEEANQAVAAVIDSAIPFAEKRARIQGIKAAAGGY